MVGIFRLLLGPILLWQGKQVRKNILRMPEPDGPRSGVDGAGPSLSLLIIGDSSAAGVGTAHQSEAMSGQLVPKLAEQFTVTWQVVAQTGWTTEDAFSALIAMPGQSFDVAIISLGVNDVTTETGMTNWLKRYRSLLDRLVSDFGVKAFVLSGLPPMGRFPALPQPLRWYMGAQARVHDLGLARLAASRMDSEHLPLDFGDMDESAVATDGFHPGPRIYARWAEDLDQAIRDINL